MGSPDKGSGITFSHGLAGDTSIYLVDLMDADTERKLDALAHGAALICGAERFALHWVGSDEERVHVDGHRDHPDKLHYAAFCRRAWEAEGLCHVPDAARDLQLPNNPLVREGEIRSLICVPIRLARNQRVGTLCLLNAPAGGSSDAQKAALQEVCRAMADVLELRRQQRHRLRQRHREPAQTGKQPAPRSAHGLDTEQRLRAILEGTDVGTWEWNVRTGELRINERWAAMIGCTVEELRPISIQTWIDHVHPDDLPLSNLRLDEHFRGDTSHYICEVRVRHKDGHWVWVHDRGRVFSWTPDGKPEWTLGTHLEISERKQREEALRKSQAFLDRTGRVAQVGGWEMDLNATHMVWSDEVCRIHGVDPGYQPTLEQALSFYRPDFQPEMRLLFRAAVRDGLPWDRELPLVRADNTAIWVRSIGAVEYTDGRPMRVAGAIQDVTELVVQRRALETAQDRASIATDSGRIGIWEWNIVGGALHWDAWMYRLYGIPVQPQTSYEQWLRCVHPDDRAATHEAIQQALAAKKPYRTHFRIVWPGGHIRHIQASGRVLFDADGEPVRMIGANWDVTEMRSMAAQLSEQHKLLRVTLHSIGDAVITTDADSRITWLNPVAERMTAWSAKAAQGKRLSRVFHVVAEQSRAPVPNPVEQCIERGEVVGLTEHCVLVARDGREQSIEDSAAPIRSDEGEILGAVLVFRDVTEQRRTAVEASYQATHDALTGLQNRLEFETQLGSLFDPRESQSGTTHAVISIDLDEFKLVNDTCGHAVGDELLVQTGKLLCESVRGEDIVARMGGDEFAILLKHCGPAHAMRVAQSVRGRMRDYRFHHQDQSFALSASIGVAPIDGRLESPEQVLKAADDACHQAKAGGRNRACMWQEAGDGERERSGHAQWSKRLVQALENDQFRLFGQPVSPLAGNAMGLVAEVLLRLPNDTGALTGPRAFLPAAERFHLISRIDRWVLKQVCARLDADTELAFSTLSVNLSGRSLDDARFRSDTLTMLRDVDPGTRARLVIEIAESAAVARMADAANWFDELHTLGVRVALDNFGLGASSFGYLRRMPVDFLKIDGQFVQGLTHEALNEAAVRSFVDAAHLIGAQTVAEAVEDPETLERLRALGVDFAQGFSLQEPVALEQLAQ